MKDPQIIHVDSVLRFARTVSCQLPDGRWVPARGTGYASVLYRIRAAWLVFTGRADALIWEQQ